MKLNKYTHLKLARDPIAVKVPEIYYAMIKEKGTVWLRNLLCDTVSIEINEIDFYDDETLDDYLDE